ncbi:ATP-binding protein [Streptomyces sp. NPDC003077]|uniref:ATP-binding protein n=1 Tax=Streptomyces sp. NPDC003077 TaxID=3154443 RepID=UPI0033BB986F
MRFSSTPRGARLARRLVAHCLDQWGYAQGSDDAEAVVLVVAELAANAVQHGHVPGCDFHLHLCVHPSAATTTTLRVDVTDARADRRPHFPAPTPPDGTSGRGLLLVDRLATRWGVDERCPLGKAVWAEFDVVGTVPGPYRDHRPVSECPDTLT